MRECSCALIIVGNEILSGKVQDSNSYFAALRLREVGATLARIVVIPDELGAIAEEVRYCSERFDAVVTSGGVGPTHDDMTIEGVARAFDRPVVINPELERVIRSHFGDRPNAAGMKMAQVPEGAVLNLGGDIAFPTVQLENVYMLPGIPELFEAKMTALMPRFASDPYFLRAIYTQASEGVIAEHLNSCLERYPNLLLGSYPKIRHPEYRVKLTLESKDRAYLEEAFAHLLGILPPGVVVRTE
jgi:molybdenum cofactor synthesis domain-containing protein